MQRWGDHQIVSAPCGHTFGKVCLHQHLHNERSRKVKPVSVPSRSERAAPMRAPLHGKHTPPTCAAGMCNARAQTCPFCPRTSEARFIRREEDVWRLYVARQQEADHSPGQLRRAHALEHELTVEQRALEAARERAARAEAMLSALRQQRSG